MPDTITASPDTTVASVVTSPDPVVAPETANPLASTTRAAIAQRYQELYGGAPDASATPVVAAAQTDPAVVAAAAEPVLTPDAAAIADPVVAASAATSSPEMVAMRDQLAQLTSLVTQLTKPPEPVAAPVAATSTASDSAWVDLIREGKFKEAEDYMITKVSAQAATRAQEQVRNTLSIEAEVSSFINDLRGKNPDLLPLEDLIAAKAATKLEAVNKTGLIKTSADYLREYKKAVTESAGEARTIVQTIRAAGAQKAMTTRTEVLSSSTLAPNAVDTSRGQKAETPASESTADYLAKRQNANYKMRGIA